MTKNILLVGVGGQGTILASKLLTMGLMEAGFDVKMSEIHGMSQRGGSVSSQIRYGEKVYSAVIEKGTADMLLAFEIMEGYRWIPYLEKDGHAIVNHEEIMPMPVLLGKSKYSPNILEEIGKKVPLTVIHAKEEAERLKNPRVSNMILLGSAIKKMELTHINWEEIISENVKKQFVDINLKAFNLGMNSIQSELAMSQN